MTEQEELTMEVLEEQMERARFETIDLGNKKEKKDERLQRPKGK